MIDTNKLQLTLVWTEEQAPGARRVDRFMLGGATLRHEQGGTGVTPHGTQRPVTAGDLGLVEEALRQHGLAASRSVRLVEGPPHPAVDIELHTRLDGTEHT